MANTPQSRKAKGRKLQQQIREQLLEAFTGLEQGDVKCAVGGETGVDIHLSPAAKKVIPFSIEAKCQEKLNIWSALEQAEENTSEGTVPVVIFKRNRSETYATIKFDEFIKIIKELNDLKQKNS